MGCSINWTIKDIGLPFCAGKLSIDQRTRAPVYNKGQTSAEACAAYGTTCERFCCYQARREWRSARRWRRTMRFREDYPQNACASSWITQNICCVHELTNSGSSNHLRYRSNIVFYSASNSFVVVHPPHPP